MSRVGKMPIKLLSGASVSFKAPNIEVKGKLGTLRRLIPKSIDVQVAGDEVVQELGGGVGSAVAARGVDDVGAGCLEHVAIVIAEGHALVRACLRRNQPGPFQIQAAIAAGHADAPTSDAT